MRIRQLQCVLHWTIIVCNVSNLFSTPHPPALPFNSEVLKGKEDSTFPWTFVVKLLIPSFQTSGLQHCARRNFYCLKPPRCGHLLWQPRELIYLSIRWWYKGNSFAWWVPCYYSESQVKVKCAQSCPILCDPTDYTVHGILQARMLEWVAVPFSRGSSQSRDQTQVSRIAGGSFTSWATREAHY